MKDPEFLLPMIIQKGKVEWTGKDSCLYIWVGSLTM